MTDTPTPTAPRQHFIRTQIENDLGSGKHNQLVTRFPPEPNGYLHIGHAKSICLNFSLAQDFNGVCHLRFDDTNPIKEEQAYVDAIKEDVRWLGFDWQAHEYHASDYFDTLYAYAVQLIQQGHAYVDSLSGDDIRAYRGTLTTPGKNSPYRNRSLEENVDLFARMKAGEFKNGECVLRAKIDMSAGNINLRDPVLYRILHAPHQRTQANWCIYPLYDFAHSVSDAIEGITHSLCTLEFQDHRPLYDWFIETLQTPAKPQQIEFARLNLSHTITSKRKLRQLVEEKHVSGWDDPRMPTLKGMRRRGYPAVAIRRLCERVGISKSDSVIDMNELEACVRDELNAHAPRAMCVCNPVKVIIENFEGPGETLTAAKHPNVSEMGQRTLTFSRELWIERDDFMFEPTKGYFRLSPGKEVRLRNAYVIRCERVDTCPDTGEIKTIFCHYDVATLGKKPEGRKVKGVIHWVDANRATPVKINCFERLFNHPNPASEEDFYQFLNPASLVVKPNGFVEPWVADAAIHAAFQFERLGYFAIDETSSASQLVVNRIVSLRESADKNG